MATHQLMGENEQNRNEMVESSFPPFRPTRVSIASRWVHRKRPMHIGTPMGNTACMVMGAAADVTVVRYVFIVLLLSAGHDCKCKAGRASGGRRHLPNIMHSAYFVMNM